MCGRSPFGLALLVGVAVWVTACEREARPFQTLPVASARSQPVTLTPLHPGDVPAPASGQNNPFQGNAYGIAEGKRLYSAYNCVGCHANGGGGMGPPLMDDKWISEYLRNDRRGTAERHAVVPEQDSGPASLDAHRLRAVDERQRAYRRASRTQRSHALQHA